MTGLKNADGRVGPAGMENLPKLVEMLCLERGLDADVPASPLAQWETFRALVNTRPPCSTSEEFLSLQDELLQGVIAWRGVTDAREVLPAPKDERLALWRGDITTLRADAIVNAANSQMLGCFVPGHFCIDNAINTFAGVQLRLECARLMRAQGHAEPSGAAKVTDAFNLPSRYVIHTVGPVVEGSTDDADRALLASCYRSCLDAANDLSCRTIAFCCISTGVFGFPQEEAAPIAVNAVVSWLDEHSGSSFERVIFDVFGDGDFALYRELLG